MFILWRTRTPMLPTKNVQKANEDDGDDKANGDHGDHKANEDGDHGDHGAETQCKYYEGMDRTGCRRGGEKNVCASRTWHSNELLRNEKFLRIDLCFKIKTPYRKWVWL